MLFHGALGQLAGALSRLSGPAAWGWAGATVAAFVLANLAVLGDLLLPPAAVMLVLDRIEPRAALVVFALAVWPATRRSPPGDHPSPQEGQARP
ncbi:hypothetical protein [Falsiroseomonas sp.]|uniref:hypothetical protein n=1 Tax=Falsiroseomonas sp. TaxID=2870721 RepID=UPI003564E0F1